MVSTIGMVAEFEREMANTRRAVVRIPDENLEWKPHPRSMSMARIGTHLAELSGFIATVLSSEQLDIQPGGAPRPAPTLTSLTEIVDLFDRNVTAATAALTRAGESDWSVPWTLLAHGVSVFTMPRFAVVRGAMNHIIHHRGQLTVYLRLNDIAVPALYGPSADE